MENLSDPHRYTSLKIVRLSLSSSLSDSKTFDFLYYVANSIRNIMEILTFQLFSCEALGLKVSVMFCEECSVQYSNKYYLINTEHEHKYKCIYFPHCYRLWVSKQNRVLSFKTLQSGLEIHVHITHMCF